MADYQLRARIPNDLGDRLKGMIETINKETRGVEATFSTVSRQALKEYVEKYEDEKEGNVIVEFSFPYKEMGLEYLEAAVNALSSLLPFYHDSDDEKIIHMEEGLEKMQIELELKKLKAENELLKSKLEGGEKQ